MNTIYRTRLDRYLYCLIAVFLACSTPFLIVVGLTEVPLVPDAPLPVPDAPLPVPAAPLPVLLTVFPKGPAFWNNRSKNRHD